MASETSRRTLMTGVAAAFVAIPAGVAAASAAPVSPGHDPSAPEPTVRAVPVTPTMAAVAVDSGGRSDLTAAEVTDAAGVLLGRAVLTVAGTAVIPVPIPAGQRRLVRVTVDSGDPHGAPVTATVTVDGSEAAVRASLWRVVNKRTPMRRTDQPAKLAKVAGVEVDPRMAEPLKKLLADASRRKLEIYPSNGFRSYDWQSGLYESYVQADGVKKADTYSARPGFSEHQTGLSFDAKTRDEKCSLEECFGATPAGRYLATDAGRFGFIVRYTEQNRSSTGYQPEPWHMRYVGAWLVRHLQASKREGLEDVFALPVAPDYT